MRNLSGGAIAIESRLSQFSPAFGRACLRKAFVRGFLSIYGVLTPSSNFINSFYDEKLNVEQLKTVFWGSKLLGNANTLVVKPSTKSKPVPSILYTFSRLHCLYRLTAQASVMLSKCKNKNSSSCSTTCYWLP